MIRTLINNSLLLLYATPVPPLSYIIRRLYAYVVWLWLRDY